MKGLFQNIFKFLPRHVNDLNSKKFKIDKCYSHLGDAVALEKSVYDAVLRFIQPLNTTRFNEYSTNMVEIAGGLKFNLKVNNEYRHYSQQSIVMANEIIINEIGYELSDEMYGLIKDRLLHFLMIRGILEPELNALRKQSKQQKSIDAIKKA